MKYKTVFHETARKHSKTMNMPTLIKVCKIESLKKIGKYKLIVDGISVKFKGVRTAAYFQRLYTKLGYTIETYIKYEEPEYAIPNAICVDDLTVDEEILKRTEAKIKLTHDEDDIMRSNFKLSSDLQELKEVMRKIANKHSATVQGGERIIPTNDKYEAQRNALGNDELRRMMFNYKPLNTEEE